MNYCKPILFTTIPFLHFAVNSLGSEFDLPLPEMSDYMNLLVSWRYMNGKTFTSRTLSKLTEIITGFIDFRFTSK